MVCINVAYMSNVGNLDKLRVIYNYKVAYMRRAFFFRAELTCLREGNFDVDAPCLFNKNILDYNKCLSFLNLAAWGVKN